MCIEILSTDGEVHTSKKIDDDQNYPQIIIFLKFKFKLVDNTIFISNLSFLNLCKNIKKLKLSFSRFLSRMIKWELLNLF